jgi:hypothetical protein
LHQARKQAPQTAASRLQHLLRPLQLLLLLKRVQPDLLLPPLAAVAAAQALAAAAVGFAGPHCW